jgi:hypothetical protein
LPSNDGSLPEHVTIPSRVGGVGFQKAHMHGAQGYEHVVSKVLTVRELLQSWDSQLCWGGEKPREEEEAHNRQWKDKRKEK